MTALFVFQDGRMREGRISKAGTVLFVTAEDPGATVYHESHGGRLDVHLVRRFKLVSLVLQPWKIYEEVA